MMAWGRSCPVLSVCPLSSYEQSMGYKCTIRHTASMHVCVHSYSIVGIVIV